MKELSVIIPVYNEERAIASTIAQIKDTLKGKDIEIIAVNDGSTDNTANILSRISGIKQINHAYNLGYGASLKTGIKNASADRILIIDADGTYPVKDIPKLLKYSKDYDMVVGARTGSHVKIPFFRKPAKLFLNQLANFLSGTKIPDINSGLRVFKKEIALRFFHLFPSKFSFTITITLACLTNDYTVKYIPINYFKRAGKSTIHPIKDFIGFTTLIFRMMTLFKPMKMFSLLSMLMLLTAVAVFVYSTFVLGKFMDVTTIVIALSALQIFIFGLLAEMVVKERSK